MFMNDDQVIAAKPEVIDDVLKQWNELLEEYGIPVHPKKPFTSDHLVFCEIYKGVPYNRVQLLHLAMAN